MQTVAPFLNDAVRFISALLEAPAELSQPPIGIRTARAGDEGAISALVAGLSMQSRHYRFFVPLQVLPEKMLSRFTHADPSTEWTVFAVTVRNGVEQLVGMANYVVERAYNRAEYAVVVDDAWQGQGIAHRLLQALEETARQAGLDCLYGEVLAENDAMLAFAQKEGFAFCRHPDDPALTLSWKPLRRQVTPGWPLTGVPAGTRSAGSCSVCPAEDW